jgi:hypothetical protein
MEGVSRVYLGVDSLVARRLQISRTLEREAEHTPEN